MATATQTTDMPRRGRPPKVPQSATNPALKHPKQAEVPFWDWLASFTPDEWNYRIAYLWRVEPITNRERNAKEGVSIGKYSRPFDMQTIKHEHGSGTYRLDVCQIPVDGRAQTRLRQEYIPILDPEYPPRVPYGDGAWLKEPENAKWIWAEEHLRRVALESKARIDQMEKAAPQDPVDQFVKMGQTVRALVGNRDDNEGLTGKLIEMLMANQQRMAEMMAAANDPKQQMALIKAWVQEMMPPQQRSSDDPIIGLFRDALAAARQETAELRAEMREMRNAQAKPQSIGEQLREVSAVLSEVGPSLGYKPRGDRSPNSANPGTDLGSIALQVIDRVSERLAPALPMIVSSFFAARSGQAPQPGAAPNPAQLPPPPAQEVHIDMSKIPEDQKPAVEELQKRMNAVLEKYGQLFEQVAMFMVDQFRADESGEAFRDWFIDRRGRQIWIDLRNDAGPEVMTALIGTHAALKSMMTPPEKVALFFQEFFSEPGEEEPEETA